MRIALGKQKCFWFSLVWVFFGFLWVLVVVVVLGGGACFCLFVLFWFGLVWFFSVVKPQA